MPGHTKTIEGTVSHVFAHRFVVETEAGAVLADLTPKGAEAAAIHKGDVVRLTGEMKPSELKVFELSRNSEAAIEIDHHEPHDHADADPAIAVKAVVDRGYTVMGVPRRKPKHFEVLGRDGAGGYLEFHVELDGHVRKSRPADHRDPKWTSQN